MLRPIPASEWVGFKQPAQEILKAVGGLPVNDVFLPIWDDPSEIKLLRGGRGGGKSEVAVDRFLDYALTDPYFKCYYGRKVFDTVRGSCFATLIAGIKKNKLEKWFNYSEANSSAMVITAKNGNSFIPFGADKPDKLKSIKDPTVIWGEELDQFEETDFMELFPTLRTERGRNEFWGTFNSYAVYENHWILKLFYPEFYRGDDKPEGEPIKKTVKDLLANYYDNYFIDQEGYKETLWMASGRNLTIFDGLANGHWGVTDNKNPWLYGFDKAKHTRPTLPFLQAYDIYLAFDFNNDPFACTVWQMSPDKGTKNSFIHCIKEFSGFWKVEEMCERIRSTFPSSILHITGDRSGQNEDIGRNQTLYQIIASLLGVNKKLMDLNTHNLEHSDSRIFMNAMFANYPNILLSQEGCPNFIRQCQNAKTDSDSKKPGQLLKDRGLHKNDEFDSGRYFFQTYFHDFAKKTYIKILKK